MDNKKLFSTFSNGIIRENPVLRLVLGTCPTLAVTTSFKNGIGMGIAATAVLICSNVVISLVRNIIPSKVRIPAFITIIAGFVSIVQMLVKAFVPSIDAALGIYLPLIVVNCIILARAEMFACKNSVLPSALDGLGMGIGFTTTLAIMGLIREIIGTGSIFISDTFTVPVFSAIPGLDPMIIFILPPGGFFVFGVLVALSNKLAVKKGKEPVTALGCANCPGKDVCTRSTAKELPEEKQNEAKVIKAAEEKENKETSEQTKPNENTEKEVTDNE